MPHLKIKDDMKITGFRLLTTRHDWGAVHR